MGGSKVLSWLKEREAHLPVRKHRSDPDTLYDKWTGLSGRPTQEVELV